MPFVVGRLPDVFVLVVFCGDRLLEADVAQQTRTAVDRDGGRVRFLCIAQVLTGGLRSFGDSLQRVVRTRALQLELLALVPSEEGCVGAIRCTVVARRWLPVGQEPPITPYSINL